MTQDLERFLDAQAGGGYDAALDELRAGRKTGHWMWFVFPQLRGLGSSAMAQRYGIASLDEARAYAVHDVLGARLVACARALLELDGGSDPVRVVGEVDAMKLRSSMTLFERAAPDDPVFGEVLDRYYAGERDDATLSMLRECRP